MKVWAKKLPTWIGLLILIGGLAGGMVLVRSRQPISPRAAEAAPVENLTVSNISDNSFTVSWTTRAPAAGQVWWGEEAGKIDNLAADDRDLDGGVKMTTTHYVTVGNLGPETTYYFKVKSGEGWYGQGAAGLAVKTGPSLPDLPPPDTAQGVAQTKGGAPAAGAIVYLSLPGGQLLSGLVTSSGNWMAPLSTARSSGLSGWLAYDRSASVYTIQVEGGAEGKAAATVTTALDRPVPPIRLGETYDFRQGDEPLAEAAGGEAAGEKAMSQFSVDNRPVSLFTFDEIGAPAAIEDEVTLDNPAQEGEMIYTDKPEFFGRGPAERQIEIIVWSDQIQTSVSIGGDGRWRLSLPDGLEEGAHTITLQWRNSGGEERVLSRTFQVMAAEGAAFTATPSAAPTARITPPLTLAPTASIRPSPTPAPPPRTALPSGPETPESGNLSVSVMLFIMGLALVVSGMYFLKGKVDG